jgi:hypothetical protein
VRNNNSRLESIESNKGHGKLKSPFLVPVLNGFGLPTYSQNSRKFVKKSMFDVTLKRRKSDYKFDTSKQLIIEAMADQPLEHKNDRPSNVNLDNHLKT